jgi:cold shock protein
MKGKVKFFNDMKGFGFIASDDGKEVFVHQTGLQDGVSIREDDTVEFDVVEGEKGPKAENVRKVEAEEAKE